MPHRVHVPADVRAALHWLAIRRPRPWAHTPAAPDVDIATIISERRIRVAQDGAQQAAEQQQRFTAAVEAEVARRLA